MAALLVPVVFAACSRGERQPEEKAEATARSGVVTVSRSGSVAASWIRENRLHLEAGGSRTLAAAANATLIGTLAPLGVSSASGAAVIYNSWRGQRPTLRIHDLATGRDSVVADGAHSAASASDGRLAYFQALKPELGDPRRYLGHVVVRRSQGAPPRPWTARAGRYVVAAWARRLILVYRLGRSFPDLLVLDGPRQERLLARATALVAVSPDGRRAFLSEYDGSPPLVRIVDLASGSEVARLRVEGEGVRYVNESGSWTRDLVFAPTTTGVAAFRVAGGEIHLEQALRGGATFPLGLFEPQAAADGRTVLAWGELEPRPRQGVADAGLVECDRVTLRCVRAAVSSAAAPPRPVYNPSRP